MYAIYTLCTLTLLTTNVTIFHRSSFSVQSLLLLFVQQQKALFLQFVTGTSKVPLEGFAQLQGMRGVQKFNIHRHYGGAHLLPSAHTCFNQLDLPEYTSEEQTRTRLMLALKEGSSGFGFA
jgi:E3 ubiquitin-protein ligase HUWE1